MLDRAIVDGLFPADLPTVAEWEQRYPPRELPDGAQVTRVGPSPTGSVHIGSIYVAMLDKDIARRTGGRFLLRVEDTDQAREVEGASEQFGRAFGYFGLEPDEAEDLAGAAYGPYHQTRRVAIYHSFVRELLHRGQAYLCFATSEELAANRAEQQSRKIPSGYYGQWAPWRDAAPEAVQERLAAGSPYVVRFRSPGTPGVRTSFSDAVRGELAADDNFNDAVVLKSSGNAVPLPTYHFAHVVDDHLMRVNLVIRGEEWLPSVPLHRQLFAALDLIPPTYGHIALLQKQIPGGKRKLSKRKDPEAGVHHYIEAGYPADAVLYYLRGLANGRLAELPLADALAAPIRLEECGGAGPLVDLVKLEDISADHVATLSGEQILAALIPWAQEFDPELAVVLGEDRQRALRALDVERVGVENVRKDLRKWSDFRPGYAFFFPALFTLVGADDERATALLPAPVVRELAAGFVAGYREGSDQQEWFEQIRTLAAKLGLAANAKEFKKEPDRFAGSVREAAQVIRVALTGSTRSPDLYQVAATLGADEVVRRVSAMAG